MKAVAGLARRHVGSISVLILAIVLTLLMIVWMGFDLRDLSHELIANQSGDTQLNSWLIYQAIDNLRHRPTNLGYSAIFYGDPESFAYTIAPYGIAMTMLPMYILSGDNLELTYNLYFIATFVLTAWVAFLLIRYLLRPTIPIAVLISLGVAFAQFRLLHFMHIETLSTQFYLLALYCLHRLLDQPRAGWALGLAVAFWCTIATSGNLGMAFVVTAAVVVGYAVIKNRAMLWGERIRLFALTAILVGVAVWPIVGFRYRNPVFGRGYDLSEAVYYSANPLGWVSGVSLIYSYLTPTREERSIFIGVTPLVLSAIAWHQRKRASERSRLPERLLSARDVVTLYGILIAISYLLTLGPGIKVSQTQIVPLPAAILAALPGFASVRAYPRYILLAVIGTTVLSAHTLTYLSQRYAGRVYRVLFLLTALFLTVDLFPNPNDRGLPRYFTPGPPRLDTSAYDWLRQQPANTLILEYPVESDGTHFYIHQQRYHGQLLLNGKGSYVPDWQYRLSAPDFPTEDTVTFLQERGVRYILIHKELLTVAEQRTVRGQLETLDGNRLRFVGTFGAVDVYELSQAIRPV